MTDSEIEERHRLLSAINWLLQNIPEHPPAKFEEGFTAAARIAWEDNIAAASLFLQDANPPAVLAEPKDLVLQVETEPIQIAGDPGSEERRQQLEVCGVPVQAPKGPACHICLGIDHPPQLCVWDLAV